MNVLLVYPRYPDTFWSFKYALKFIKKQAVYPPLGLLTVAAMLPEDWNLRLVDLNVTTMNTDDARWADLVMISAMEVQKSSVRQVVDLCKQVGVPTAAGGPLFTEDPFAFKDIDYLILNEGEITLPQFLADLEAGRPKHIYLTTDFADLKQTPPPRWDLVELKPYSSMNLQYSRGCPYDCEFCDITALFGRRPRTKTTEQILRELDAIYERGWRGSVFFVDDNFIGKRKELKRELLPAIAAWNKERRYPFVFNTEVSINLADDEELMELMVEAGFDTVFVGIETPNEDSLAECNKFQNRNRSLIQSVRKLHKHGLQVQGGFIIGFDSDGPNIFQQQIRFIQQSGIVTAMVGLLNAPRLSKLYKRLKKENRIIPDWSGNNTDFSTNIIPKLPLDTLVAGYKSVVQSIYSPREYYARVKRFLRDYQPRNKHFTKLSWREINAFLKSIWLLGVKGEERVQYWSLLLWTALRRPRLFPLAVTLSIYGYHFRLVFQQAGL